MPAVLFSVPSFRFGIESAIGRWSRVATFGEKQKGDARMVFDASTLGQMVDNAAMRGDPIAVCADHLSAYVADTGQQAPALAWFDALAVVSNGKVLKSWNGAPEPMGMEDGLYARMSEITPRGADPLLGIGNYKFLSPMFSTAATDEAGNDIGFALFDVAVTNTPHQAGTEIQFHGAPAKTETPAPIATTQTGGTHRLGVAMDDTEMAAKFGWEEGDDDAKKLAKCLAKFAADTKAEDEEKKDEEKKEETMSADADSDDKVKAMSATLAAVTARLSALEAEKSAREAAERAARDAEVEKFANEACEAGYPKDSRAALVSFARSDMNAARAMVAPLMASKTNAPAHLLSRVSANGAPLAGPTAPDARNMPAGPVTFSRTMPNGDTVTEIDGAGAKVAREMAESKDPVVMARVDALATSKFGGANPLGRMLAAQKLAEEDHPHLFTRAG